MIKLYSKTSIYQHIALLPYNLKFTKRSETNGYLTIEEARLENPVTRASERILKEIIDPGAPRLYQGLIRLLDTIDTLSPNIIEPPGLDIRVRLDDECFALTDRPDEIYPQGQLLHLTSGLALRTLRNKKPLRPFAKHRTCGETVITHKGPLIEFFYRRLQYWGVPTGGAPLLLWLARRWDPQSIDAEYRPTEIGEWTIPGLEEIEMLKKQIESLEKTMGKRGTSLSDVLCEAISAEIAFLQNCGLRGNWLNFLVDACSEVLKVINLNEALIKLPGTTLSRFVYG